AMRAPLYERFNPLLHGAPNRATLSAFPTRRSSDLDDKAGSITINDVTIAEGDAGTKTALFTVSRAGGSAAFDVNFATANDTATAGGGSVVNTRVMDLGQNVTSHWNAVTINDDTSVH